MEEDELIREKQEKHIHWFTDVLEKPFQLYDDYSVFPIIEYYPGFKINLLEWEMVFSKALRENFPHVDVDSSGFNGISFTLDVSDFRNEEEAKEFIQVLNGVDGKLAEQYKMRRMLRR